MKRVQQYADEIGGRTYNPNKRGQFDYDIEMNQVKSWINKVKREGRDVLDVGPDFRRRKLGRGPSDFYNMERRQLKSYDNYKKAFQRTGKNSGGVPGIDY